MPGSARRLIFQHDRRLKEKRDELALQVHLGQADAQSELKTG